MALSLKELSKKEERIASGHRLCAGCGAGVTLRQILLAIDQPVVVSNATGCIYVSTASYPYTAWNVPYIHSAFENSGATISGIEAAYQSLKKQGKVTEDIRFISLAGDGGTYDIGLQSLSGALERGHRCLHICYNNEAYMNTGIQRSGATPIGASTTTSPAGKQSYGKRAFRKDLTGIVAAHNIPYVAQATPANWRDLMTKVQKAVAVDGPSFINILSPCFRGWRSVAKDSIKLLRLAVDSCYWPLYEVDQGEWKLNYQPKTKLPVVDWMKPQGRFKHLFPRKKPPTEATHRGPDVKLSGPPHSGKDTIQEVLDRIQANVDQEWQTLLKKCSVPKEAAR